MLFFQAGSLDKNSHEKKIRGDAYPLIFTQETPGALHLIRPVDIIQHNDRFTETPVKDSMYSIHRWFIPVVTIDEYNAPGGLTC